MKKIQQQRAQYNSPRCTEHIILQEIVFCASNQASSEPYDEEFDEFNW